MQSWGRTVEEGVVIRRSIGHAVHGWYLAPGVNIEGGEVKVEMEGVEEEMEGVEEEVERVK